MGRTEFKVAVTFPCQLLLVPFGEGGWKQVFAESLAHIFWPGKARPTEPSFLTHTSSHWPEVLVTVF